jgi:hypothetical protein
MELPGVLKQMFFGSGQGLIELCPDEYDMANLSTMLEEALADCEALVLSVGAEPVTTSGAKD